ncbi:Gp49 family protein [Oceanidesulfovibrio marinus]|uniref:Uncharacterized protein n=1 Tax=Oceanidesulfovibrio marinus TaxID=370038 RepID=A0A6P1ZKM1_9BACT|nr:Gp49 family protein [Oceanidesulfovibrio marinus]TVM35649.1 hypothetical protein DQK91_02995 [Oceanidesulfovibrio marinus]
MTKEYIGVKKVTAWPEEKDGKPGYAVKYADGYTSWSPKDVFERAYLPLADPAGNSISTEDVENFFSLMDAQNLELHGTTKTTLVKSVDRVGFVRIEASSCVDPANYDPELGGLIASRRIKDAIWSQLGFVLQWAKNGLSD